MEKIAVIMTVHNRREKTLGALSRLYGALDAYRHSDGWHVRPLSLTVYLTDDGCTDGTAEAVEKQFAQYDVHIVQGDGQLYWAGGMRKAWRTAIDSGTPWDYYLLLNDDTRLHDNAFGELLSTIDYGQRVTGRPCMASGLTCQPGRPQEITYGGLNFVSWTRGRQLPVKPSAEPQRIDMTNANILLVQAAVTAQTGIFHDGYVHGCADNDYSMTARRHGLSTYSTRVVCGECERDHYSQYDEIVALMQMTLAERRRYVSTPTHSDHDYLLLVRRNMPLRYPLAWVMRTLRIYLPALYCRITHLRGVYRQEA